MTTRCLVSMAIGAAIAISPLRNSSLAKVLINLSGG